MLHQGRIERFFLDSLKQHSDIVVERGVLPQKLTFNEAEAEDEGAYPIEVVLRHLTEEESNPQQAEQTKDGGPQDGLFRSNMAADDTEELLSRAAQNSMAGSTETIRAKYMIGCDGAHSWTRKQIGYTLEGEQTDYIWGVLDIIPITDFREFHCPMFACSRVLHDRSFRALTYLSGYSYEMCHSFCKLWFRDGHSKGEQASQTLYPDNND